MEVSNSSTTTSCQNIQKYRIAFKEDKKLKEAIQFHYKALSLNPKDSRDDCINRGNRQKALTNVKEACISGLISQLMNGRSVVYGIPDD